MRTTPDPFRRIAQFSHFRHSVVSNPLLRQMV
jgi:hypothetical protein